MDSYEIQWKRSAERDLWGIEQQYILQIIKANESLADNPFPSQCRKLMGAENLYRIRIGNYTAIYQRTFTAFFRMPHH
ncbi:MAG: type II toxin-antitoxin system RelE/ParE family toxin [Theionarchaea archaeon]|nr:MAG: hypothetical protein AYK19_16145 [Theionarchaea archaeon DG-70-1]MBU7025978.1 type II toxin-antitoxin system RelE/ParE family toxin [Theionarchaea archaeon]